MGGIPGLGKFRDQSWKLGTYLSTFIVCALWGAILIMGVTDPLGGINVLFPLFGIANQLLAAMALALVVVVVVKKGLYKWVWIPLIPLAWDLIVTMTASWQKIFSSDPTIGYWANHARFKDAAAQGLSEFGSAKSVEEIDAVVRNTFIQGCLSILFAVLVLAVIGAAVVSCIKAVKQRVAGIEPADSETEDIPSTLFLPRGMMPTKREKEVAAQYNMSFEETGGH